MVQRYDPFETYGDLYGEIIDWEHDPMNKPANQNKYFFSDGRTYYEQILKMLKLMSVFKASFKQIYDNEDEITGAWENFVNNLSATATVGEHADVTLTWEDGSVSFDFVFEQGPQGPQGPTGPEGPTGPTGPEGPQGVSITNITFNSDYTMIITLSNGNTYTSESLRGATGPTGPEGPQGPAGQGLQILDTYPTLSDLQTAHPTGQPGDAYQVGTAPNFTLYIWSSSQSQWVPAGSLGTVSPSLTDPLMDGTASAGSSDLYSRGDHRHPTDTSRASVSDLNDLSDMINESTTLTDQEFIQRQSPAEYDGLANIDKIKGNTLVFNQLVQNGNFSNTDNWSGVGLSISASNNVMTLIPSAAGGTKGLRQVIQTLSNHKYLCCYAIKSNVANQTFVRLYDQTTGALDSAKVSTVVNTKVNVGVIIEPQSNYSEIRITPINPGAAQTTDVYEISNVILIDLTLLNDNRITDYNSFKQYYPLDYYDFNAGSLLSFNGTGLKTENASQTENNTLSLPVSTYFPSGMKSAGSVYDELTESKAITRIGSVDLGSLTWYYSNGLFLARISDGVYTGSTIGSDKGICPLYVAKAINPTSLADKEMTLGTIYAFANMGNIVIKDTSYTSSSDFKTAMNGVYLFYELETPTEQDIDIDLTYPGWNGGTEQILPVNTATPTTSPIICDMTYMGVNDEILYLYNNSGASEDIEELRNDISNIETEIGSETTTPKTGILGRVNTLESNVSGLGSDITNLETEIGSDSTTPMTGLAGRIKTIENALNNLKGKVVFEYTSTSTNQGYSSTQLNLNDLNNATHIEVIYSLHKNGNDTLSTGIIPYKFYNPSSIEIAGTISDHQMDQDRGRPWGITSSGALQISSCTTYYSDSHEVTNDYLIIRQVILYKFTRASSLI